MFVLSALYHVLRGLFVPRLELLTENLAQRQQPQARSVQRAKAYCRTSLRHLE